MEARAGTGGKGSSSDPTVSAAPRQKWALSQEAFDKLLASLDPDRDRSARNTWNFAVF